MKISDIFVGTIKKCNNLDCYKKYGEERFEPDFIIGNLEMGITHVYYNIIKEDAILIKVSENQFIWLDSLDKFTDELLVDVGIPIKKIKVFPEVDNGLYVDEKTVKPYFKNLESNNENIRVKTLKKHILLNSIKK